MSIQRKKIYIITHTIFLCKEKIFGDLPKREKKWWKKNHYSPWDFLHHLRSFSNFFFCQFDVWVPYPTNPDHRRLAYCWMLGWMLPISISLVLFFASRWNDFYKARLCRNVCTYRYMDVVCRTQWWYILQTVNTILLNGKRSESGATWQFKRKFSIL